MEADVSFVDVRGVTAAYAVESSVFKRLAGQMPQAHEVLRDVSFELAQGEQAVLFGPAGSGKSTLLKLLAGLLSPTQGRILINGLSPAKNKNLADGFVASAEKFTAGATVHNMLRDFGEAHAVADLATRLAAVAEQLKLGPLLDRDTGALSTTEALRVNLAQAALAEAPLLLLDDVAEQLGAAETKQILTNVFAGQTVIIATRQPYLAEALDLPILLLHQGTLMQYGTREELACAVACPRVMEIWIEGLRYDLLRQLKVHPGVLSIRLISTTQFAGQKLRLVVRSSRYLPSLYDLLSQTELVRVEELPVSLAEILKQLK